MNPKARNIVIVLLVIIVFVVMVGYAYYRSKDFIIGPQIEITKPTNGSSFFSPVIKIVGEAKNISYMKMNGRQIFMNENNIFEEKYILSKGRNFISIIAEDRFGRINKKVLDLILLEANQLNYEN